MNDRRDDAHRALREQLGVYALGHGDTDERAAVRAHLDGCAACRAELAALTPLAARLADVDPDRLDEAPAPPPELADAVLARIAAADRATVRTADRVRARHLRGRLVAVGVSLALAAAAFGIGWLVRPVPDPPPLEPVAVQVADTGIRASADVVPHTWGVEVKLAGTGFAVGEVYRVTVTSRDGEQVPAGEFVGVGSTPMACNLNASVLRADATGFQVRDARGAVVLTSEF